MTTPKEWKTPAQNWPEEVAQRIAVAIRTARGKRSAAWLSERTGQLGLPLSRSVISDLETGRKRSVDTAELIVIAAALGVPPITLLYPLDTDQVDALPDWPVETWDAARWFTGERRLSRDLELDSRAALQWENAETGELLTDDELQADGLLDLPADRQTLEHLKLLRILDRLNESITEARISHLMGESTNDAVVIEVFQQRIDDIRAQLAELRAGPTSGA